MKKYNKEFKEKVCKLVEENHLTPVYVSTRYKANINTLYHWLNAYRINKELAFKPIEDMTETEIALKKLRECIKNYPEHNATVIFLGSARRYLEQKLEDERAFAAA